MKQIFIINGSGGVGKDTFIKMCRRYGRTNVLNISTVDKVKKAAKCLGWDEVKDEEGRKFLSDLKILAGAFNDHSFKYVEDYVNKFRISPFYKLMFVHAREPEEIERLKLAFGCKTILVVNDNVEQITTNMADGNVYNYEYDFIIDNSGTMEDLDELSREFIKNLESSQNTQML